MNKSYTVKKAYSGADDVKGSLEAGECCGPEKTVRCSVVDEDDCCGATEKCKALWRERKERLLRCKHSAAEKKLGCNITRKNNCGSSKDENACCDPQKKACSGVKQEKYCCLATEEKHCSDMKRDKSCGSKESECSAAREDGGCGFENLEVTGCSGKSWCTGAEKRTATVRAAGASCCGSDGTDTYRCSKNTCCDGSGSCTGESISPLDKVDEKVTDDFRHRERLFSYQKIT